MIREKSAVASCVQADPVNHVIRVEGGGFWRPDEIDLMLDRLAELVAQAHRATRQARVLVDLTGAGAQMGDTVARIGQRSHSIYAPGDRLAIVLQSAILRMQISRVGRAAEYRTFASVSEAEGWLLSAAAG